MIIIAKPVSASRASNWCRLAAVVAVSSFLAGCASKKLLRDDNSSINPPSLVAGPAVLLLTNAHSYSARVTLEVPSNPPKSRIVRSILLNRGSRVLIAPVKNDTSFVWDTAQNSGFVINEALEGFAPFGATAPATNFIADVGAAAENVNGHPAKRSTAIVSLGDGTVAKFNVWRATDLNDFPLRIQSVSGTQEFTANLTDVTPATPATDLFDPPEGFSRYDSIQALKDELTIRKARLKNKTPVVLPLDGTTSPMGTPGGMRY